MFRIMQRSAQDKTRRNFRSGTGRALGMGRFFLTVGRETFARARRVDLPIIAGSLAFTTVLSLAPLLAVIFSGVKVLGGVDYAYKKLLPFILENLSEGTGEVVEQHLHNFIRQVHARAVGWVGLAALTFTALLAYFNIVRAFNRIWEIRQTHTFQHRILRAVTLFTIAPILLTGSIAITTAIAARIVWVPYSGHLITYVLSVILYSMVYGLVPMVKVPVRVVVLGSLLPAALWEAAKFGYTIYTRKVVTYSAFYGSFAVIPLFLLWIYIAWYITLFGGVWVRTLQLHLEKS